jgi:hypothetical protein
MTQKKDSAKAAERKAKQLAAIAGQQEDLLRVLIRRVLEEVMEAEMEEAVGAEKGQRTASRTGYRSGYYRRTLVTRVGKIELRVPQDREGRFQTEVFERYQRSEKALVGALAEMYVQGVSTRRVKEITEQLCGHEFSASAISRINGRLDEELEKFARRPLEEEYPYLVLDARYERVREDGVVRTQAVLVAIGINWEGQRCVLAGGAGAAGERGELEGVSGGVEREGAARGAPGGERRSCRAEAGGAGGAGRSAVAEVLRALPAQCEGLAAAARRRRLPDRAALDLRAANGGRGAAGSEGVAHALAGPL